MRVACCVCVCALCCVCVVSVVFVLCAMYVRCVRLCACVRSCVCVCAHVFVWVLVYVWRCLCASVADATPYNIDRHVCVCVRVRACVWVAQLYANDQFCMLSLACPWSAAATMLQAYMATKLVAPTEPGLVARACCAHGCDHLTQHRSSTSSSLAVGRAQS